jgi:WD40 repeat protein
LATGEQRHTLNGHRSSVKAVALTADGKQAISASKDRTLKLWDLATGKQLRTLKGHSNSVKAIAVTFDGKQVISASYKTLKLWDLATGKQLPTLNGHSEEVRAVGRDSRWQTGDFRFRRQKSQIVGFSNRGATAYPQGS